jgi:hypothetical protein
MMFIANAYGLVGSRFIHSLKSSEIDEVSMID